MIGGRADAADVSTASSLVEKMPPSGGGFLVTLHNIEDLHCENSIHRQPA